MLLCVIVLLLVPDSGLIFSSAKIWLLASADNSDILGRHYSMWILSVPRPRPVHGHVPVPVYTYGFNSKWPIQNIEKIQSCKLKPSF